MIVNPWIFYLMCVCEALKSISLFLLIGSVVTTIFILLVCDSDYSDYFDTTKKIFKFALVIFIISLLIYIFIPGDDTLLMMQAAKIATTDNINAVFEALKNAIDYTEKITR